MLKEYYDDNSTVKEALQVYFSRYHFKDGGYNDAWFRIKAGPFFIPLPNTKDRVAAVKIHDVHHVLTGFKANYRGEVQIGGWEVASGCGRYYVAWLLNFGSFLIGLFAFPRPLYQAFMQGRRIPKNLYSAEYNETLLNSRLGDLRASLLKGEKAVNTPADVLLFVFCSVLSLLYLLPPLLSFFWFFC